MSNEFDRITRPFEGKPRGGVTLLANVSKLEREPFTLGDDVLVRRATFAEVERFRDLFDFYHAKLAREFYEAKLSTKQEGHVVEYRFDSLPVDEFRYHVIERVGGYDPTPLLRQASVLTDYEMHVGHGFSYGPGEDSYASPDMDLDALRKGAMFDYSRLVTVSEAELQDLADVYARYHSHRSDLIPLNRITSDYIGLRKLSAHPNLRVLAMFGLLESLLTHNPKPSDPYDSITRQITQKIKLLNARFRKPLPYRENFGEAKSDKVWKALYAVRSAVAHGGELKFQGDQALAKSLDHTERFVRTALRAVMRQALEEPQLIADLKDC